MKENFLPVIMGDVWVFSHFSVGNEEKYCSQKNANDGNEKGGILLEKEGIYGN